MRSHSWLVRILEADPTTDWSKVDLESLRQHLIDMNEVTLKAGTAAKPVDGGLEIAVTGADRTLAAIRRMLPAHAREIDGRSGWSAKTESLPNGELLTVTSNDPKEVQASGTDETGVHRLIASRGRSRIQIETTAVMRGTVHPVRTLTVQPSVERSVSSRCKCSALRICMPASSPLPSRVSIRATCSTSSRC